MLGPENTATMSDNMTQSVFEGNSTRVGVPILPKGCVLRQTSDVVPWDNRHTLIPKQAEVIANFVVSVIGLPVFFLISLSTNLLSMAVFCKQGLKERVNMCLFSLSLLDLLYVAVIYGMHSSVPYMFAMGKSYEIGASKAFFFNTHLAGFHSLATGSQTVSTVVALERCVCIARPLLAKNLMSTGKTALFLWILVLVLIAGGFLVDGFRLNLTCVFDATDNSTTLQYFPTHFYMQNMDIINIFGGTVFGFVLPALCAVCVIVCTVIIVVEMKKLSQWRKTVSSASDSFSSRDLALTRMIVGTSVLFIVCIIPTITVRVAVNLVPGLTPGGRYENLFVLFARCFYFTTTTNSTFNFFVYYTYGTRFRQTVHQMFSCCLCLNKQDKK